MMTWDRLGVTVVFMMALSWGGSGFSEEREEAKAQETIAQAEAVAPEELKLNAGEEGKDLNRFWFVGTSNYHNKLSAAEDQIDSQINTIFGSLFCNWKKPRTFNLSFPFVR